MDVGNTNIKLALFEGQEMKCSWRIAVKNDRTADEFAVIFRDVFGTKGYTFDNVDGIIISSVVPGLNYTLEHTCSYYMNLKPLMVSCDINTGLTFNYSNPRSLGADRIANAVAAYRLYGGPCIVVDMGTATTFGAISQDGVFLGGAISPGIKTSLDALVSNASQLPLVELTSPKSAIATSTISNMQSGIIFGFTGLVKNIILNMKNEINGSVKVIATGGMTNIIYNSDSSFIDVYDRALTLKGLQMIYSLNNKEDTL